MAYEYLWYETWTVAVPVVEIILNVEMLSISSVSRAVSAWPTVAVGVVPSRVNLIVFDVGSTDSKQ
jgi:hypothetical protein